MDTLKISLWLFLVLSSASISKSKTLKYNAVGDNCFCFNIPGDYKTVPDIMNQDENNLDRIVVHFYKLKDTGEIKMYIPNREKQALIPHLAFEVGDKLNTVNDNDSASRMFHLIFGDGMNLPHALHFDNTKVIQPVQDLIQEHAQVNDISEKDNIVPNSNEAIVDPSEEQTTSNNELQNEAITLVNNIDNEPNQPRNPFTENSLTPEKDTFIKKIINTIKNNDQFPINNIIKIPVITSEKINITPDIFDAISTQENNLPVEPNKLNTDKYLSEQKATQNIEPHDDYERNSEEYNETNNVSPTEETSTTRSDISPTGVYEQQTPDITEIQSKPDNFDIALEKPDIEEVMSIKENEPENTMNDKMEETPLIENAPQKTIEGGNEHWHVEEITEPATPEHNYNEVPKDVLDIHFPHQRVIVPIHEQNNHPHIHSNDQNSYKDTIVMDKEENIPVNIHFSEKDIHKDVEEVNGQPGGYLTTHENSENLIHVNPTQPNSVSSEEEHESVEIPLAPNVSDGHDALDSHHHHNYQTFEHWFTQQMKRFKTYTKHDRTINLLTIERYILKILHDNGMHVTTEGVLADSFGTALDVRKLNLRPILIGDTVTLGKLFNTKGSELVLPTNKAYLQAILVTNSKPSLMLGIIPIGKTVLPPSTKQYLLNPYVLHNTWGTLNHANHLNHDHHHNMGHQHNHGHNYNLGHYHHHHPKTGHWYKELLSTPIHKKNTWKGFTVVKKPPTIEYKLHEYLNPIRIVKSSKTPGPYDAETVISGDSVESPNKLITAILEDSDPVSSVEMTNELLANLRNGEGLLPAIPINPDEGDIGDDLDPRIIGGQPATSSGTPLNIKGRMSGF